MPASELDEWLTLGELAVRWKTSLTSLRRMCSRTDESRLRHMRVGLAQIRVHKSEVYRHEQPAGESSPVPATTISTLPTVYKRTSSLMEKKCQSLRKARARGASVRQRGFSKVDLDV